MWWFKKKSERERIKRLLEKKDKLIENRMEGYEEREHRLRTDLGEAHKKIRKMDLEISTLKAKTFLTPSLISPTPKYSAPKTFEGGGLKYLSKPYDAEKERAELYKKAEEHRRREMMASMAAPPGPFGVPHPPSSLKFSGIAESIRKERAGMKGKAYSDLESALMTPTFDPVKKHEEIAKSMGIPESELKPGNEGFIKAMDELSKK